MRVSPLLFGLLGLAAAQDVGSIVGQLPSCSIGCVASVAGSVGCQLTDFACLCSKKTQLTTLVTNCLQQSCATDKVTSFLSLTDEICGILGTAPVATATATTTAAAAKIRRAVTYTSGSFVTTTTTAGSVQGSYAAAATTATGSSIGSFATTATGSSIGSSIAAAATSTTAAASTVATAGAAAGPAPAALLAAGVVVGMLVL